MTDIFQINQVKLRAKCHNIFNLFNLQLWVMLVYTSFKKVKRRGKLQATVQKRNSAFEEQNF